MGIEQTSVVRKQIEQPQLIPIVGVDEFLFPQKEVNLRLLLEEIKPSPFKEQPLLLIRTMSNESVKGFLLGVKKPLEELKISADDFEEVAERMDKGKIGGVVLFMESGQLKKAEEIVVLLMPLLEQSRKVQGKLWVLENIGPSQKLSEEERELRETILEANGLVKTKVVGVGKEPFVLWYGRKEKETARHGIDLTGKFLFKEYSQEMTAKLRLAGWANIDVSEITAFCQNSHFALRDYRWLRDGRGIKVAAHCGCTWHCDLDGSWTKLLGSHDEECEGVLKPLSGPEAASGRIPAGMKCRDCDGDLVFDRRVIGPDGRGRSKVVSDLVCPSCPSGPSLKSTRILHL